MILMKETTRLCVCLKERKRVLTYAYPWSQKLDPALFRDPFDLMDDVMEKSCARKVCALASALVYAVTFGSLLPLTARFTSSLAAYPDLQRAHIGHIFALIPLVPFSSGLTTCPYIYIYIYSWRTNSKHCLFITRARVRGRTRFALEKTYGRRLRSVSPTGR